MLSNTWSYFRSFGILSMFHHFKFTSPFIGFFLTYLLSAEHENSWHSFYVQASGDFAFLSAEASYNAALSDTCKTETRWKFISEQCSRVLFDVLQMEELLNITMQWSLLDPEHTKALKYMNQQKHQQCLEWLHKLVIQQLFELHKMNLSQTGK